MNQNHQLIAVLITGIAIGVTGIQITDLNTETAQPTTGSQNNLWQEEIWNISYLANHSDVVVKGTVTGLGASQAKENGMIYHPVEVDVEKTLQGEELQNLELRVEGGTVGNSTMISQDSPSFAEGDEAIMFIEEENGYYEVFGNSHGVFYISGDEAVRRKAPPKYRTVDLDRLSAEKLN